MKVSFAVFPRRAISSSLEPKPGTCTKTLFLPCLWIVGSLVPVSSTLLLMISSDCSITCFSRVFFCSSENVIVIIFSMELIFSISFCTDPDHLDENNSVEELNLSISLIAKSMFSELPITIFSWSAEVSILLTDPSSFLFLTNELLTSVQRKSNFSLITSSVFTSNSMYTPPLRSNPSFTRVEGRKSGHEDFCVGLFNFLSTVL